MRGSRIDACELVPGGQAMNVSEGEGCGSLRRAPTRVDIPAWETSGLGNLVRQERSAEQELVVAPWMHDSEGDVAPGVLAVLSDSVLGWAVMSSVPEERGMATSHLHLELLRALPRNSKTFHCKGIQRAIDERFGLGEAEVADASGALVAKATIGAVLLDARPNHERSGEPAPVVVAPAKPSGAVAQSPVLSELGTKVLSADASGVRLHLEASPRFANASGGIHGGFGVLMGERTLDLALRTALAGERSMRPVEVRAAFLRPIVADGTPVESRAMVMHLGRRLAAARGELCDHRGRPAVLVDATYIAV